MLLSKLFLLSEKFKIIALFKINEIAEILHKQMQM